MCCTLCGGVIQCGANPFEESDLVTSQTYEADEGVTIG